MSLKETCFEIQLREKMFSLLPELISATDTLEYLLSIFNCDTIDYIDYKIIIDNLNTIHHMYSSEDESTEIKENMIIERIKNYLSFYQSAPSRNNLLYIIEVIMHIIGAKADENVFFPYDLFSLLFSTANKEICVQSNNHEIFFINQEKYNNKIKKAKKKYSLLTEDIRNKSFTIH